MKEQKESKERKSAPPVVVDDVFRDDRSAQLSELDKDSDYIHSFQNASVKADELRRKGLEVVKDESGAILTHGGDIVVRQPKSLCVKKATAESKQSFEFARKIRGEKNIGEIMRKAAPKNMNRNIEEE